MSVRLEASHSGLVHTLGKRATRKGPRVRISPPPQSLAGERRLLLLRTVYESLRPSDGEEVPQRLSVRPPPPKSSSRD